MTTEKTKILESLGKELPSMKEAEKTYLMGFLEGVAAMAGVGALTDRKTA